MIAIEIFFFQKKQNKRLKIFFLYIIRRKPCTYIVFGQITIIILLFSLLQLSMITYQRTNVCINFFIFIDDHYSNYNIVIKCCYLIYYLIISNYKAISNMIKSKSL